MNWLFWVAVSVLATSVSNLLQRVIMREKDSEPFFTMLVFQLLATLMTGLFALSQGFILPPIREYFWSFLLSGLLWGYGAYTMFKAYQLLGSSENAIISAFSAVVTIITSLYFLGESFDIYKTLGTLLILVSVLAVSVKKGKLSFSRGAVYALISTVCFGLGVTNDAFILRSYDAVSYTPIAFGLPGILLLLIKPSVMTSFRRLRDPVFTKNIILLSFFYSAQAVAYYLALQSGGNASQIAPIFKANIVITVFLAVLFLREREHLMLKAVSAVLVTAGVLLVK